MRPTPSHALSPTERAALLAVANDPRFADVPPARIVPMLADEGVYLGSESSMARVLREHGQTAHRGRAKAPRATRPPTTHIATAPGQVWCWDMTYLPAVVMGRWYYLYLILDLYSRKIVGAEVHERDDADHAVHLVRRTALAEGIAALDTKPVLHGDNGSTLKATSVLAMLHWLGVKPSYSRPRWRRHPGRDPRPTSPLRGSVRPAADRVCRWPRRSRAAGSRDSCAPAVAGPVRSGDR